MNNIKISACIITYNHELFIRECIEGALKQKTDYTYEINIFEDCSTDKTREIILEYKQKYPDKINLFLNEKNLGLIGNWVKALDLCQGEYVAICEGDDYWTDPNKLQKQIDFLDNHHDFALSSHNADIRRNNQVVGQYCNPNHPKIMDLEYILAHGSGVPTCSLVIRNKTIKNLPEWFSKMQACDWTVQIIATISGEMKYFDEIMSTYRKHDQGAIYNQRKKAKNKGESDFALPSKYTLEMIDALNKHFHYKYDKQLCKQSTYWYHLYIIEYLKINDIKMAKKYAIKILKEIFPFNYWKNSWMTKKEFIRLLTLVILPSFLIRIIKKINKDKYGK